MNDSTDRPTIPARVRSVVYFTLLGVAAVALGVEGLAPIWTDPDTADKLSQSAGVVVAVTALIGGGLGVTYRPTRNAPETGAQTPSRSLYED